MEQAAEKHLEAVGLQNVGVIAQGEVADDVAEATESQGRKSGSVLVILGVAEPADSVGRFQSKTRHLDLPTES